MDVVIECSHSYFSIAGLDVDALRTAKALEHQLRVLSKAAGGNVDLVAVTKFDVVRDRTSEHGVLKRTLPGPFNAYFDTSQFWRARPGVTYQLYDCNEILTFVLGACSVSKGVYPRSCQFGLR